ncbi:MAG TPA: AGE family epimerase/isomerase [Vicinamibacteria bacterium]|nr:AGE family epimerase/isomerase [Vicinamibacteria bacterium]
MDDAQRLLSLADGMMGDLRRDVLPFWAQRVLDPARGFHGAMDDNGRVDPLAPMGAVLCARLLWTFSAALRRTGEAAHRGPADHFFAWLTGPFWDRAHGGIFWMLDHEGRPLDERKQTYALAFALYALAEYRLATGSEAALSRAREIFDRVERCATDEGFPGYAEARSREWAPLADVRLSEKDQNAPRSMNTHLHLMEAYANLLRAWPEERLRGRLRALVELHTERVLDRASGHLLLFFDERFRPLSRDVSYGHDIEASWLLPEAAEAVGEAELLERSRAAGLRLAQVALREGLDRRHGGIFAERRDDGRLDDDKHWWMQAEAIVGFLNAYQVSREPAFLAAAEACWRFVERFLVDPEHGEWRWRVRADGTRIAGLPRVEPWKCPYHNARAALEAAARVSRLLAEGAAG